MTWIWTVRSFSNKVSLNGQEVNSPPNEETNINSALKISKYPFNHKKMWWPRLTYKLSNVVNSVGSVRSGKGIILERTNLLTIFNHFKQEISTVSRELHFSTHYGSTRLAVSDRKLFTGLIMYFSWERWRPAGKNVASRSRK